MTFQITCDFVRLVAFDKSPSFLNGNSFPRTKNSTKPNNLAVAVCPEGDVGKIRLLQVPRFLVSTLFHVATAAAPESTERQARVFETRPNANRLKR